MCGDEVGGNDGGGRERDDANGDYFEEVLRTKRQVKLKSAKGLKNLERLKAMKESLYWC